MSRTPTPGSPPADGNGGGPAGPPRADEEQLQAAVERDGKTNPELSASDADQTASDADQTASDADQALAESDQALSGADQGAADRDQQAADRDLAGAPLDEVRKRAYDISRVEREESADGRATTALLRGKATADRFNTADRRDETAHLRDLAAEGRDRAASARDRAGHASGDAMRDQAASDRTRAAKDRERAAADRKQASVDRDDARKAVLESHADELTGTHRRGMGKIALQAEIDRARRSDGRLVLAFVDVDDLKQFNDREGHVAGDALLIDVVGVIRSKLRSYDPVVRFGGDEFVCTLADSDLEDARLRFDEIQAALGKARGGCSISVGFARLRPGDTLRDLTARADAALYEVKHGSGAAASA